MPFKLLENECSGYLKKWAKIRYKSRWFKISEDNILRHYENSSNGNADPLGRLQVEKITIFIEKESDFIITDQQEKYYLIADSFEDRQQWISELIKRGASLDPRLSKKSIDRVLSETKYYGHLQKLDTILYHWHWFVLCDEYLTYYSNKGDKNHDGRLLIQESVVSDDDDDDKEIKFILKNGNVKYNLRAATPLEKKQWITELEKKGARWEIIDEAKDLEYYGELIPRLSFPHNYDENDLSGLELNQKSNAKEMEIAATVLEKAIRVTVKVFVPSGGVAVDVADHAITAIRNIFDSLSIASIEDMQNHLKDEANKKRFEEALEQMQAEMSATQKRYENLSNSKFSLEEKKAEIPVAIFIFEKTLALFNSKNLSFPYAFLMSPFLKKFAVLFLDFSNLVSTLHPNYSIELGEQLQICVNILEKYKTIVVNGRIAAIVHSGKSIVRRVQSFGKLAVNLPEGIWKGDDMRLALPVDKVEDKLYPTPTGLQSRWAYPRERKFFQGSQFYENYKAKVEELYQAYFDEIINPIFDSELVKSIK